VENINVVMVNTGYHGSSPSSLQWRDVMSPITDEGDLTEPRRKEIFLALVESQDQKVPVAKSRTLIAKQFGVSERVVSEIEQEGLNNDWPPL
jgi:hypothetical protein